MSLTITSNLWSRPSWEQTNQCASWWARHGNHMEVSCGCRQRNAQLAKSSSRSPSCFPTFNSHLNCESCVCDRNRPQPFAVTLSTVASAAGRGFESVSSWLVTPQLYWRLHRRYQCEWSVLPQLYWRLQRRCQCEWYVSPQLYWRPVASHKSVK